MPSMTSSTSKPKTFRAGWWPPYVSFASKQPWPHQKICRLWRCFDLAGPPFLCWYVLGALLKSIGPDRFSSNSAQLAYVLYRGAPVCFPGRERTHEDAFSWTWNNVKACGSAQYYILKTPQSVSISIMELFIHTWFTMKCVYDCIEKSQLPITIARTWLYHHWLAGQAVCCKAKLKRFIIIFGEPAKIWSKIYRSDNHLRPPMGRKLAELQIAIVAISLSSNFLWFVDQPPPQKKNIKSPFHFSNLLVYLFFEIFSLHACIESLSLDSVFVSQISHGSFRHHSQFKVILLMVQKFG